MTEPLFTVAGLQARPLSAEDAAAARELFASCDGSEDLTCGLPIGTADDPALADAPAEPDLRIGVFEGPDTAGVIEVVRDVPTPGSWTIGLLMVETGRRGATLGHDVVEEFARWATRQGATGLLVGAPAGPGESFWRSAGFSEAEAGSGSSAGAAADPAVVELRRPLVATSTG